MFEEPVRFFEEVIENNRSVLESALRQLHICESRACEALRDVGRYPGFQACRSETEERGRTRPRLEGLARRSSSPGCEVCKSLSNRRSVGTNGRCRQVRSWRFVADGRVPDPEFPRPENQPGQARVLGGAAAPGRGDSSSATKSSRAAAGRSQRPTHHCATMLAQHRSNARFARDAMRALTYLRTGNGRVRTGWREVRTQGPGLAARLTRRPPSLVPIQGSGFTRRFKPTSSEKRQQDLP